MSWLSRLFGGGGAEASAPEGEAEEYKGFAITPKPMKDSGGFRIAARIEKDVGGEVKRHDLVRADVCSDADEATRMSVRKARQVIDEQGEKIFR